MSAIRVQGLGKAYKSYPSNWARLAEWVLPGKKVFHTPRWVLRDIDFDVLPGEALGVVGVNGAGKSTLLKIITGTTIPTAGSVAIEGRIAALLELGMGFHGDFTGRQNVYTAGQLLGMSIAEIDELMPRIENFAEIGSYIDQPVRVYSSGMQMRLAFSVATARRPDILIVDEALSVGDTYFQHKSFDRIREFRREGTTLMLVSHDKGTVQSICDRVILLNEGRLEKEGDPAAVMDYYNALLAKKQSDTIRQEVLADGQTQTISGSEEVIVENVKICSEGNDPVDVVRVGQKVRLQVTIKAFEDVTDLVFGYMIKDRLGQTIFGTNTSYLGAELPSLAKGSSMTLEFSFHANIGPGSYSVTTGLHTADSHIGKNYQWKDLAHVFTIVNVDKDLFAGYAWVPPEFSILR